MVSLERNFDYDKLLTLLGHVKHGTFQSCDLRHRDIGLNTFKSKLKTYYKHALPKVYNCDDPRTWKSICVNKCRRARSLDGVLRCC